MSGQAARDEPTERSATAPPAGSPRTFAQAAFGTSILVLWREWRASRPRSVLRTRPAHRSARAVINASGLPPELSSIVDETMRHTRLRRSERVDIAYELVSHLREGLDAGVPAAALRERFGDPMRTARLLRTAAVAKRGAVDRAFGTSVKWGGIGLAGFVVVYLVAAVRLAFLEPVIRFDPLDRLRAGLPANEATPPAWPTIRSAMDNLRPVTGIPPTFEAVYRERPNPPMEIVLGDNNGTPITPEAERAAGDLFRAHAADIALLRQAASRSSLGFEVGFTVSPEDRTFFGWSDPTNGSPFRGGPLAESAVSIVLPQLSTLRIASRVLAADARLAVRAGDGERAVGDLAAMLGMADFAEQPPILVSQLVGTAIRAMTVETALAVLAAAPESFSDADLARLAAVFGRIPPAAFELDLEYERVLVDDVVQRVFTDDGLGDGVLDPEAAASFLRLTTPVGLSQDHDESNAGQHILGFLAAPAVAAIADGRRATVEQFNAFLCAAEGDARKPLWQYEGRAQHMAEELYSERALRQPVLTALAAIGVEKPILALRYTEAQVNGLRVTIALERYRRAHGAWPASLADLVPTFLPSVPPDPFDGAPLRYVVKDGVPVVYSIGVDRNDDGGTPTVVWTSNGPQTVRTPQWMPPEIAAQSAAARKAGRGSNAPPRGDWILNEPPPERNERRGTPVLIAP